ncbi:tRNA pseudouridine(65) synthase TruC [Flocculibacter collagenilyticus]|uniref:tRNA pseudouridine(65) synthase TruC n=1 Tax=Flocculibacter collagenilyticus TaxID=2744479 RepID=UPI0018F53011|nr:tRNA pseudouridine(65) synthase TruC [Flocculibacter collagenilyticus]
MPASADSLTEISTSSTEQLDILYQDEYLVVVDKPSGLLVHRSMIDKNETRFAMQIVRDQIGQYVYPVHRLDKPTSGVLVMALSSEIAAKLSQQFAEHTVQKRYLAVVRGFVNGNDEIDYPLVEMPDKMTDKKAAQDKPAQPAVTRYNCLQQCELPVAVGRYPSSRYSLVELFPKTGRKHQLRRHMKHIFHPIVGDTTYGDGKHNTMFREHYDLSRLLLIAKDIEFNHPVTGERVKVAASLGSECEMLFERLGWKDVV